MTELVSIVTAAQAGDLKAFEQLVSRFQDAAYGIARGLLRDPGLAEEAAQDAFVEAYFGLPGLRAPLAFPAWFRVIVCRCCERVRRGQETVTVPLGRAESLPEESADPVECAELAEFVRRAVDRLPESERLAVNLYFLAGHSQAEIGAMLGMSTGMVKKRLRQARERLRRRMLEAVAGYLDSSRPSRDRRFLDRVQRSLIFFSAGGRSVFSGCVGNRLYRARPDGTDLEPLTDPGTFSVMDRFPDGRTLLVTRGRIVSGADHARHCTVGLDGTAVRPFGPESPLGDSRVSPDGRMVAFVSATDHPTLVPEYDRNEVYVMELDGTRVVRLTHNMVPDGAPTWTPDGRVLFCRGIDRWAQHNHLFAIDPDGTDEALYPSAGGPIDACHPVFSPDGSRIAFCRHEGPWYQAKLDLWVMDADGRNQERLTDLGEVQRPTWSPDGRRLAFACRGRLSVVAADGSSGVRPEPVDLSLERVGTPVWGPPAASAPAAFG